MKINFDSMTPEVLHNFKGGEKDTVARMYFDGSNRIMKGLLTPGATIGMHTHDTSSETILITKGCGCVLYDGERIPLASGDVHYCPKGHAHSLVNDSDSDMEFFAVVPQQ